MRRRTESLGQPFRTFLAAETVSSAGTMVTVVALPLVAIEELHASTLAIGVLEAVQWVPAVALGLVLGALVDRNQRRCRSIMISADLGRALTLGIVPLAAAFGALSLPLLLTAALLTGVFTAFFQSAYTPYLRQLVPPEQYGAGNASLQAGRSAARIIGPSIGGALIAVIGAANTLSADALSYVLCGLALLTITARFAPAPPKQRQRITVEIIEGIRALRATKTLAWVTGGAATANLVITAIGALEIVFLTREASLQSNLIGPVITVGGVGGLTAALLSRRVHNRYGLGRTATLAFLLTAPAALLLPATQAGITVALFAIGVFAISFGISLGGIALMTIRLQYTPPELQGRISSVSQALNAATIPLGALLGGIAGQYLGTRAALTVLGVAYIAFAVAFYCSPVRTVRPATPVTRTADV